MVIDGLQHDLDRLRSKSLQGLLLICLVMILSFGMLGQKIEQAQVYPVIVLILSLFICLRLIAECFSKKCDLSTFESVLKLKPLHTNLLQFSIHLGLILSAIIICLIIKHKLTLFDFAGFLPLLSIYSLSMFFIRSASALVPANAQYEHTVPGIPPTQWIESKGFDSSEDRPWFMDGAHPFSCTNPASPNFPGKDL